MRIVYAGFSDTRSFSKADFERGGVEGDDIKGMKFHPGEVVEVPDAMGEALTGSEGLFGDELFEVVEDDEEGVDPRTLQKNVHESDLGQSEAGTSQSAARGTSGGTTSSGTSGSTGGGKSRGGSRSRGGSST